MPLVLIDLIVGLMLGAVAYALYAEGAWGATLMFFNILFSAMVALNFYEPLAAKLATSMPAMIADFSDVVVFYAIFGITVALLRFLTDSLAPTMVKLPNLVDQGCRVLFGLLGGATMAGVLVLGVHLAPVHQLIMGKMPFDHRPPFKLGVDVELLAFFQRTTGGVFAQYGSDSLDPFKTYGDARVFDPYGRWLILRQLTRPFPSEGGDPLGGEAPAPAEGAEGAAPTN